MIAAFLHATRIGMFEISWNVLCPGCGGVLDTNATLKTVQKDEYVCSLCAAGYSPTLDEMVEVTFTVSPRVRKIAAHTPHELPLAEYYPPDLLGLRRRSPRGGISRSMVDEFMLDHVELAPGEKGVLSVQLPAEFIIIFDPVTHSAQFIDVKGEPTTRAPEPVAGLRSRAHPQPDAGDAARPAADLAGEPHRHARPAERSASPARRCTTCSRGGAHS